MSFSECYHCVYELLQLILFFFVFFLLVNVLYILLFIGFLWAEVEVYFGAVPVESVHIQLGFVAMAAMSGTVTVYL